MGALQASVAEECTDTRHGSSCLAATCVLSCMLRPNKNVCSKHKDKGKSIKRGPTIFNISNEPVHTVLDLRCVAVGAGDALEVS